MKFWKYTLIATMAFFGIATTTVFTSCEQDSCLDLKCKNGGSCAEGFCRCPTGFEGAECEIKTADRFVGLFIGHRTCSGYPPVADTVEIFMAEEPIYVKYVLFSRKYDTLSATVEGTHLAFDEISDGVYRRDVSADYLNNQIKVFDDEIFDVNTGYRLSCNFIGSK